MSNPRTLVFMPVLLLGCASSTPAEVTPEAGASALPSAASEPETPPPPASASGAATSEPPPATGPSTELSGSVLKLSYGGTTYTLSDSSIHVVGGSYELHFQEPMDKGYNQIWLIPREVQKGKPAKVEGFGMTAVFVQLAAGTENVRNVSNSCKASGTVTYADLPKPGGKGAGSIDVVITCEGVAALTGPINIKGDFAEVPLKK